MGASGEVGGGDPDWSLSGKAPLGGTAKLNVAHVAWWALLLWVGGAGMLL